MVAERSLGFRDLDLVGCGAGAALAALEALSAIRWLSRNVPLALAWSTTAQPPPRRSMRACFRETEPSFRTTSHVGSRPTMIWSLVTSIGSPEAGTRRKLAMTVLLVGETSAAARGF
jgi:hypothetical protein